MMKPGIVLVVASVAMASTTPAMVRPDDAVSPDGRWHAWVRPEKGEGGASGQSPTSLWLTDRKSGAKRQLFRGSPSTDPRRDTVSVARPDFSLDGGYVYVEADAYATSPAIHQIDRETGRERFVVDGGLVGVLRSGPWRGFLVVQQHRYHAAGGSYDPMFVYRPDGHLVAPIPGTDRGDAAGALAAWLRKTGWRLS